MTDAKSKLIVALEKLKAELPDLMSQHSYNPSGSDYVCGFCKCCGDRHDEDCLGLLLQEVLQ